MAKAKAKLKGWPADSVERWSIDRIKEYRNNARLHSPEQIEQIAASMTRFGVTTPLLVDESGELIFGHGRCAAAKLLGYKEMPVSVARGWSEEEKRAYRIADNQLALTSEWSIPLLKAEIAQLSHAGFDMPLLGFPEAKLVQFMAGPAAPGAFHAFGEDVETSYCCPRCNYAWSGAPKPKDEAPPADAAVGA